MTINEAVENLKELYLDYTVNDPDLTKHEINYREAEATARMEERRVVANELEITASLLKDAGKTVASECLFIAAKQIRARSEG